MRRGSPLLSASGCAGRWGRTDMDVPTIIILVVIAAFVLLLFRKRKPKVDSDYPPETGLTPPRQGPGDGTEMQ